MSAYLAEMIFVSSITSNSDRQGVEGYLAHKWGLSGSLPSNHSHKTISLTRGPSVTTDATSSSSAGTYYVRPSGAAIQKVLFHLCGWGPGAIQPDRPRDCLGSELSGVGVGQTVDLNASATSGLAVLYSVSDTSVAELAVTNQSSLQAWYKLDETRGGCRFRTPPPDTKDRCVTQPVAIEQVNLAMPSPSTVPMTISGLIITPALAMGIVEPLPCGLKPPPPINHCFNTVPRDGYPVQIILK